jgi:hypothetical protein
MVQEHSHNFLPNAWPFADAVNTTAFASVQVLDGAPILLVFRDHDGEWQFLHGPATEQDECCLICLGCAYDRDRGVGILAGLEPGWMASRSSPTDSWNCEPYESDDGHEA